MKIPATTKKEFFENAGQWGADLRKLDRLIREVTEEKSVLCNGMGLITRLGYKMMDYTTSRGTQKWPVIAIAPQKNYMALYVCAVDRNKQYLVEKYGKKLGEVSCGKSCIRFKKYKDLDEEVVRQVLKEAMGDNIFFT